MSKRIEVKEPVRALTKKSDRPPRAEKELETVALGETVEPDLTQGLAATRPLDVVVVDGPDVFIRRPEDAGCLGMPVPVEMSQGLENDLPDVGKKGSYPRLGVIDAISAVH